MSSSFLVNREDENGRVAHLVLVNALAVIRNDIVSLSEAIYSIERMSRSELGCRRDPIRTSGDQSLTRCNEQMSEPDKVSDIHRRVPIKYRYSQPPIEAPLAALRVLEYSSTCTFRLY